MSLISKVGRFARSPQGKKLMRQAQEAASKPENRRKIAELRGRVGKRGRP
jgi:hypothetical protein